MNDTDAQRFAQKMIETWPTGPRRSVWTDQALEYDDLEAARRAYTDLARAVKHISVADFHDAYRNAKRAPLVPPLACEMCDSTGWVDATFHLDGVPAPRTAVKPCRCSRGELMKETQRRILEANAR